MRDYVAWYLVELRRRLRGVEPQSRVEDFLLETKTHLHESIEDMTSRGIKEEDAERSAIIDFGHPVIVSSSFRGVRGVRPIAYWSLVGAVVLVLSTFTGEFVRAMSDSVTGSGVYRPVGYGLLATIGLGSVALIGYFSRRWVVVPIALGTMAIVAVWGTVVASRVEAHGTKDQYVLFDEQAVERQIALRDKWLAEYDERVRPILDVLQSVEVDREDFLRVIEQDGMYLVPNRVGSGFAEYFRLLPDSYADRRYSTWVSLDRDTQQGAYVVMQTGNADEAMVRWRHEDAAFTEFAKRTEGRVRAERQALTSPIDVPRNEVLARVVGRPLLALGVFALFAALVNALVVSFSDAVAAVRRLAWKRMVG